MSIQGVGTCWSGLIRVLAVLAVLAGVFAMHGLTGNHDTTMAGAHVNAASPVAAPSENHPVSPVSHSDPSPAEVMNVASGKAVVMPTATQTAFVAADGRHAMAGACVAVLTGLILLLALLLGIRSLLAWRRVQLPAAAARPALTGLPPPWLVVSPSKLCVSRT